MAAPDLREGFSVGGRAEVLLPNDRHYGEQGTVQRMETHTCELTFGEESRFREQDKGEYGYGALRPVVDPA